MKKILLIILFGISTIYSSAQGFYGEFNIGIPAGDSSDILGMQFNSQGGYLWEISPSFYMGPTLGASYIFTKNENANGLGFLDDLFGFTLSGTTRYSISPLIDFGIDLGYGFVMALVSGGDTLNGFYYRPNIGFNLGGKFSITVGYSSLNVNEEDFIDSISSFQIGLRISK